MKTTAPGILLAALALFVAVTPACAGTQSTGADAGEDKARTADRRVAATVNGEPITVDEVEKALGPSLDRLEQQIYELKLEQTNRLIADKLLASEAARRNMTVEALVAAEIQGKLTPVADQDVEQFYEENRSRLRAREDIKAQIRRFLEEQREGRRREEYLDSLRRGANVEVSLTPPPVTRANVSIEGAPYRGPADAPVTIVEFSDFHCPFCRGVKPALAQVMAKYPQQVKWVYRDLPLDSLHPAARAAAEAARCAQDQGRFWEYHDELYAGSPDGSPAALRAAASKVGLDLAAFDQCVASGKHRDAVQRSVEEAEQLGATGTPAFFINGRMISGALPFETFDRYVQEELSSSVKTR